jgi:hypothetical protein
VPDESDVKRLGHKTLATGTRQDDDGRAGLR